MKPFRSIVPIALLCGLVSASGAGANPQDVLRLAQGGPPQTDDKNGGGDKEKKEKKDNKNRGKGQDKKDNGGKGPDRPDRGPRERKGDRPPESEGGKGSSERGGQPPQKATKPPQKATKPPALPPQKATKSPDLPPQKTTKPALPPQKATKPTPRTQEERKGVPPQKAVAPKVETKSDDKKGPPPSSSPGNGPDNKGRDQNHSDRNGDRDRTGGGRGGPDKDADWKNGNRGDNKRDDRKDVGRGGPPNGGPGRPERGRWSGGKPPQPSEARDINDLKSKRKERSEDGGRRVIIEEPDKRRIIREGGRTIIRHDETERFRRISRDTRREKRNGLDISVTLLPGGIQIFTDLDDEGRPLRRYRRDRDGRDIVLFDNRDYYRRSRGGSFLDAIIDLPPPRLRIPRERYIVEYDSASDDDIYDTLDAGPVDDLDRGYSLEEVRRSPMLRDRMRRIDLDTVNFEFGSWTVDESQYGALERVARAMNRIIDRNPGEMFLIEGHTDAVGSDDDNLSLSDRRAESVAIILTEEFGVPPENLTTQGYGEQYLKVPTDGPERLNRRVAVRKITPLLAR